MKNNLKVFASYCCESLALWTTNGMVHHNLATNTKWFINTVGQSRSLLSRDMRFPTMWYVRPAKPQIRLHIRAVSSEPLQVA